MTDATPTERATPSDRWLLIRRRREALERALQVARAVERLHRGLHSALLLESVPRQLAVKAQDYLAQLDRDTLILPTRELYELLASLDRAVEGRIEQIAGLAGDEQALLGAADADGQEQFAAVLADLEAFRRQAQTAVAVRLLLRERGVTVEPVRVEIPRAVLQQRVARLRVREHECRGQVREQVVLLQQDLGRLLDNPELSAAVRAMAQTMQQGLVENLRHLDRGGDIDTLPMPVESVELGGEPSSVAEPEQSEPAVQAPDSQPAPAQVAPPRRGFWGRLGRWLSASWRVRWRDL